MSQGPDFNKPDPTKPADQVPAAQQPSGGPGQVAPPPPTGLYGQPVYGQPAYGQPAYGNMPYGQPPYGPPTGVPGAPYGVHPGSGIPYSDKSKTAAGLMQLLLPFVGICGVGRLYAGHMAIGLVQLLGFFLGVLLIFVIVGIFIFPAIWLWTVIDGIIILASDSKDSDGRMLRS